MKIVALIFAGLIFFNAESQSDQNTGSQWPDQLNTGREVDYLPEFEKAVLLELNKVRSDPEKYARLYIEPMLTRFNGNLYNPGRVMTREGVSAVKECIDQLKKTKKTGLLYADPGLEKTATQHTKAQSKTKQTGHTSPNGETFSDRLSKYNFLAAGECISYGEPTPQGVVTALLIDDGVTDRGHRKIVLDPRFQVVGISAGTHLAFRYMCTLDFGGKTFK